MPKKRHHIAPELREQILKRVKEEGAPVSEAAKDHGISEAAIYRWLGQGAEGAPSWNEYAKLKRENKALLELVGELTLRMSSTLEQKWYRPELTDDGTKEKGSRILYFLFMSTRKIAGVSLWSFINL